MDVYRWYLWLVGNRIKVQYVEVSFDYGPLQGGHSELIAFHHVSSFSFPQKHPETLPNYSKLIPTSRDIKEWNSAKLSCCHILLIYFMIFPAEWLAAVMSGLIIDLLLQRLRDGWRALSHEVATHEGSTTLLSAQHALADLRGHAQLHDHLLGHLSTLESVKIC